VLNWKRTPLQKLRATVTQALPVAFVLGGVWWFVTEPKQVSVLVALVLALWIVATHARDIWLRTRRSLSLPLAYCGMTTAHLGFAMSILGIAITATQSIEEDVRMAPQDISMLGTAEVRFLGVRNVDGPNYEAQQGVFIITEENGNSFELRPEKRRYLAGGNIMTEAGIEAGFLADTYVSLGEPLDAGAWAVRLHYKPLVRWVWLGALLMAFGGGLAVMDKRYRRLTQRRAAGIAAAEGAA
jgi:cytochrome c-type biogenesis protein CcmF